MSVPLELRSERMLLRRLTPAHLPDLVELDADPAVMRYITGAPNTREDYEQDLLPRMLAWDDHPFGYLAAELTSPRAPRSPRRRRYFHGTSSDASANASSSPPSITDGSATIAVNAATCPADISKICAPQTPPLGGRCTTEITSASIA